MDKLPKEALEVILSCLVDVKTLLTARAVCESWKGATGSPAVWRKLAQRLYPEEVGDSSFRRGLPCLSKNATPDCGTQCPAAASEESQAVLTPADPPSGEVWRGELGVFGQRWKQARGAAGRLDPRKVQLVEVEFQALAL